MTTTEYTISNEADIVPNYGLPSGVIRSSAYVLAAASHPFTH